MPRIATVNPLAAEGGEGVDLDSFLRPIPKSVNSFTRSPRLNKDAAPPRYQFKYTRAFLISDR